jgi:hypothetical protein
MIKETLEKRGAEYYAIHHQQPWQKMLKKRLLDDLMKTFWFKMWWN